MSILVTILKPLGLFLPKPLRQNLGARLLLRLGALDAVYSARYYQTMVEPYARHSAGPMARSIVSSFDPKSVIDIGCGSGALLVALRKLGVRKNLGLDASQAALDIARARGLSTRKFDITTDHLLYSACYDIAISMEVAEHLPADCADSYIALLSSLAPTVIFTAAHPGQGGIGHLNEQPPEYWIEKFKSHNLHPDTETVPKWQADWRAAGVAEFYTNNLIIFRR